MQAHLVADLAGDEIVVAGQYFHDDAVLLQRGDGLGGGFLGRIQKGDVALENQVRFVRLGIGGALVHFLGRDGQDAETVGAQVIVFLDQIARSGSVPSGRFRLRISNWLQRLNTASGAPLVRISYSPPGVSTMTDIIRREKSNGISSTLR